MFAPARVEVQRHGDELILRSPDPLRPHAATLGEKLVEHALRTPERIFLVERGRKVTYGEALTLARSLGQTLLDLGLGPQRPLALLSGNSIDHALYTLAAMQVGVPAAPISPAYSLVAKDLSKLRSILEQLNPGAIYVDDKHPFSRALSLVEVPVLDSLRPTSPAREEAVTADSVAKILFTSGSTGAPKGVVNTQRMLCSNQQAIAQLWPFLSERPPVTVDWLPWSHTFGANHNFNMILWHGGTLHIDGGKPTPEGIHTTIANLREVSPTLYFNVPRGFAALLPFLENDSALREKFFAELELVFYAAAALPDSLWKRLRALCSTPFVSAWGSTETSPLATMVHFPIERAGVIGLPAPGVAIKLAPAGEKRELRVKGPNVTPGYWDRGTIVPTALDAGGFLPMGDAGKLANVDDPSRGLVFDGRLAENFKLSTGTWVAAGALRVGCLAACDPLVQDAIVCGHDRDYVALLVFAREENRELIRDRLRAWNREAKSSTTIARFSILSEPPSIDHGEITDKGYLNQRACLERRAASVAALYADPPGAEVMTVDIKP
jgi:feruloyl-CoA synthase